MIFDVSPLLQKTYGSYRRIWGHRVKAWRKAAAYNKKKSEFIQKVLEIGFLDCYAGFWYCDFEIIEIGI